MDFGAFIVAVCVSFVAVVVLTPVVSFVFLRKERERVAEFFRCKPLASVFFTEMLSWIAVACVAGVLLALLLGLIMFAIAHTPQGGPGVPREERISLAAVVVVFGVVAGLAFTGFVLHGVSARKLIEVTTDRRDLLSLKGEGR